MTTSKTKTGQWYSRTKKPWALTLTKTTNGWVTTTRKLSEKSRNTSPRKAWEASCSGPSTTTTSEAPATEDRTRWSKQPKKPSSQPWGTYLQLHLLMEQDLHLNFKSLFSLTDDNLISPPSKPIKTKTRTRVTAKTDKDAKTKDSEVILRRTGGR